MDQTKYRLKNRYGLHIYLLPTAKELEFTLECTDVNYVSGSVDPMTKKVDMVDPEGGPCLSTGKDNIEKITIIDKETKGCIQYNEQEGKETLYLIKFNTDGIPDKIIDQIF
jgi:hypothetical protein